MTDLTEPTEGRAWRLERPADVSEADWEEVVENLAAFQAHELAKANGVCPVRTPWCTRHEYDFYDGWCVSAAVPVSTPDAERPAYLDLSRGSGPEAKVRINGLDDVLAIRSGLVDPSAARELRDALTALLELAGEL